MAETNGPSGNSRSHGVGTAHDADVHTDCLIIGTGPAGASLACFLAQNGMTGICVTQEPSNADTPRAHITNMAAIDCLRDIGLDTDCYKIGTSGESMIHTRWSSSFAGEEYARIYSWGNDPARWGDYELASPSRPLDLPQTLLEPILMRYATLNGFQARFDTKFVSFVQDASGVTTTLYDKVLGKEYRVRSKYLFGADGARSPVVQQLGIPLIKRPGQGYAINILIEADMAHLMESRMGNLHWLLQPHVDHPDYAWIACIRMVKPWHEWLCIVFPTPEAEKKLRPPEDYLQRVREFIGDDSIEVEIKGISTWMINEIAAEQYSKGNVYCLGDAVHRHPPNHGLGSNTCIQDAHNLAWKVAYVEKGKRIAGRELLDSFSDERQPVGLDLVTQTNASLRNHKLIWEVLGNLEPTVEARVKALNELSEDSERGRERREGLQTALRRINREEHGLGIEMNQRYTSSAVFKSDQGPMPTFTTDPLEHYHPTTYPGARLPHVWLSRSIPSKAVSTLDLAGKGRFALFTGIGGDGWKAAAQQISSELCLHLVAYQIGFRREFEDRYLDWTKVRDVEESGCVLVRPDYFIAWRCPRWTQDGPKQLLTALQSVLSRR